MTWKEFEKDIRYDYSQTYEIIVLNTDANDWHLFNYFINKNHYFKEFSADARAYNHHLTSDFWDKYFETKSEYFGVLSLSLQDFYLECWTESVNEINIWFKDDYTEAKLNENKYSLLLQFCKDLSSLLEKEVFITKDDTGGSYPFLKISKAKTERIIERKAL